MKILSETEGIIFRSIKYSETSIIVDVYTENYGLKSFIVNGVRSAKSKSHSNVFQVMNQLHISFHDKEGDKLHRLTSHQFSHVYDSIFVNIYKTSVGVFIIECTRNSIKEKESNSPLYQYIKESFLLLDSCNKEDLAMFPIRYLLGLSDYLGFNPYNNFDEKEKPFFDLLNGRFIDHEIDSRHTLTRHLSKVFSQIIDVKNNVVVPKHDRDAILDEMLRYYALHIENFKEIKSLDVLRGIMS